VDEGGLDVVPGGSVSAVGWRADRRGGERLVVGTSTASKTIRRGVARVLEWFLVGQRFHTDPQTP